MSLNLSESYSGFLSMPTVNDARLRNAKIKKKIINYENWNTSLKRYSL